MSQTSKPGLSICAFGAGLAHAAVLALVLPVMITLPAPTDKAQGTIAIQVAVLAAPSPPLVDAMEGEGDLDDAAWNSRPPEFTSALPDVSEQASLSEAIEAEAPAEPQVPAEAEIPEDVPAAAVSEPTPEAEVEARTVASLEPNELDDADEAPAVVPLPLRKPAHVPVARVEKKEEAKPPRTRVSSPAPVHRARPAPRGILGGTRATTMPEYPFAPH